MTGALNSVLDADDSSSYEDDDELLSLINAPDEEKYATANAASYVYKIISHIQPSHKIALRMAYLIEQAEDFLEFDFDINEFGRYRISQKNKKKQDDRYKKNASTHDHVDPEDLELIKSNLLTLSSEVDLSITPPALANLHVLSDHLGLGEDNKKIIDFLFTYTVSNDLRTFFRLFPSRTMSQFQQFASAVTGVNINIVKDALDYKNSRLYDLGFIEPYCEADNWIFGEDSLRDCPENFPIICRDLLKKVSGPVAETPEEIYESISGKIGKTELTLHDFEYLGHTISDLSRAIINAKNGDESGYNIMITGSPGGGKTEFIIALCKSLGFTPIMTAEDEDIQDLGPGARLQRYKLQNSIAKLTGNAVTIFDECEDAIKAFASSGDLDDKSSHRTPSKLALNRTLEENKTLSIWICNDIDVFHQSMNSRFKTVIIMPDAKPKVRAQILRYAADKNGIEIKEKDVRALAKTYNFSARDITMAIETSVGADPEDIVPSIRRNLEQRGRIQNQNSLAGYINAASPYHEYDLDLMNISTSKDTNTSAEIEIKAIASNIIQGKKTSLLLTGPIGTGGHAFIETLEYETTRDIGNIDISTIWKSEPDALNSTLENIFLQARDHNLIISITEGEGVLPKPENQKVKPNPDNLGVLFSVMRRYPEIPVVIAVENTKGFPEQYERFFTNCIDFKPLNAPLLQKAYERLFGKKLPDSIRNAKDITLKALVESAHYSERLEPGQEEVLIRASSNTNDNDPRSGLNIGFGRELKNTY